MIEEREVDDMMLKETEQLLREALGEAPPASGAVPPAVTGAPTGNVINMGTAMNVGHTINIGRQTQHIGGKK